MSLNTLIEQILLSEQQLHEQTEEIKDGTVCLTSLSKLDVCFN